MSKDLFSLVQTAVGKKPVGQQYEIDYNHHLAKNIVICQIFNGPDLVSDYAPKLFDSEVNGAKTLIHDTITDYTQLEPTVDSIVGKNEVSIALGYKKTDATNRESGAFGFGVEGITSRCGAHMPWSDGKVYFDFGTAGSTGRVSASGLTFSDDNWLFVASNSQGVRRIYQNGLMKAENDTASDVRTLSSMPFTLGKKDNAGSDLSEYRYFYVFNRALLPEEAKSLDEDPYQFLKPASSLQDAVYAALGTKTVKHALRTASDWTTNQTAMEALYGVGGYYTLMSTWESAISSDLVDSDERWQLDCYNDWPTGLVDTVDIADRTTSATQNIIITSPDTEWHKGIIGAGFHLIKEDDDYDGYNVLDIYSDYTVLEKIEVRHGTNRSAIGFASDYTHIDKCMASAGFDRVVISAGGSIDNSSIVSNCLVYTSGSLITGISQGYRTVGIYNCTAFNCTTGFEYDNTRPSDFRNCVAYNCTTGFSIHASSSLTTCTNNADDDGTALALGIGTIDDVSADDFTDVDNDDFNISRNSKLHGAGSDIGYSYDIVGKEYHSANGTNYVPIGAYRGLSEFSALRVDATAWNTFTDAEKSRYNDTYYTLMSTWESALPSSLVTDNVQEVIECYNDWSSGLNNSTTIETHTTSETNNIVITSPEGERHNGQRDTGFVLYTDASTRYTLYIDRILWFEIENVQVDFRSNSYANTYNAAFHTVITSDSYPVINNCIVTVSGAGKTGFSISRNITAKNCLVIQDDSNPTSTSIGFRFTGAGNAGYMYNCTSSGFYYGVYVYLAGNANMKNCVVLNYNTFRLYISTGIIVGNNNADDNGQVTVESIGTIDDVVSSDFVDVPNNNYNLSRDSILQGAGTDIGYSYDIVGKTYHLANATYYVPIGAYRGLSEFSALRINQTAFDTFTDHEKARYNDTYYTLMSTWESAISSDLVSDNVQEVIECYNDWPSGLVDDIDVVDRTCSANNNIVITSPEGQRHNGTPRSGFYLDTTAQSGFIINTDYILIEYMDILTQYSNSYVYKIKCEYSIIRNSIGENAGPYSSNSRAFALEAESTGSTIYNCLAIGSAHGYACYLATGNTIMNCVANSIDYGVHLNDCSVIVKNFVSVNATTNYETVNSGTFDATSTNNSSSDAESNTPPGLNPLLTNVTSTDFVDIANDNYNLSKTSVLFNAGDDVGILTDIRGKTTNQDLVSSNYYPPIGAFTGSIHNALRDSQTTFDAMTESERARYGGRLYTLMSTWESSVPSDLVANNEQNIIECYDDWPSGLLNNLLVIDSRTTSSDTNIIITSPVGERHDGDVDSGFLLSSAFNETIESNVSDILIEFLRVGNTHGSRRTIHAGSSNCIIDSCIVSNAGHQCIYGIGNYTITRNCILYSTDDIVLNSTGVDTEAYNNTILGGSVGINSNQGITLNNNVIYDCTDSLTLTGTIDGSSSNNADDTGDCVSESIGTIDDVASSDFSDYAGEDYSLASGSSLINEGADLSSIFANDITGTERGTVWEIGAFEYDSTAPIAVNDSYVVTSGITFNLSAPGILDNDTWSCS